MQRNRYVEFNANEPNKMERNGKIQLEMFEESERCKRMRTNRFVPINNKQERRKTGLHSQMNKTNQN